MYTECCCYKIETAILHLPKSAYLCRNCHSETPQPSSSLMVYLISLLMYIVKKVWRVRLTNVYLFNMTRNARWKSRRPRYKAVAHVPDFDILVPAQELSLSDAKNNPFRKMLDTLYRERKLWSGNENVKIRYVSDSFVAVTSALSPGVPRHMLKTGLCRYLQNRSIRRASHSQPKKTSCLPKTRT